ncbi:hypothetical protein M427DRAFT_48471 [Gonapodya prolifera JEL478]|uniref:Uncharacterized protein n=1 Tax=Gonapodya prolifera (strain JEL478) TaxID=1344416 RepID=A0A139A0J7_GONPJ|nr:hypothetical protein M427DRAFT_48471 [Gonapodya prolifera JEL478]|eukprot:KXS10289.1 hypothetical protein M427DRAFT_48471 [Gonapodya prolifera JEL478]
MIRDTDSKILAVNVTQLKRKGHLKGTLEDFETWVMKEVDVDECDMSVLIDIFQELRKGIINMFDQDTATKSVAKETIEHRYLTPVSVQRLLHVLYTNRGSLTFPQMWAEIALAEDWLAFELCAKSGCDAAQNAPQAQVSKNIQCAHATDMLTMPENLAIAQDDAKEFLAMEELVLAMGALRFTTLTGDIIWRMKLTDVNTVEIIRGLHFFLLEV